MKIQTEFDKKIKEVYEIIALSYPPKTLKNDSFPEELLESEDTSVELKPFKLKSQSYNIQKDELTVHRTSKQLTKFFSECERRRRENDTVNDKDQNYLKYKENVVNFIDSLSSKAKAEKAHNDSLYAARLKERKAELLSDVRRSSNAIYADKEEHNEQQRRISLALDKNGQEETMNIVNRLMPIHEKLIASFTKEKDSLQDILEESKRPSQNTVDVEKAKEINGRMKNILNSAKLSEEDEIPTLLDGSVVPGAGQIGRTLKRGNTAFQSNLHKVAEGARRKSSVQAELITNMMRKAGTTEQAESSVEKKNKDKMNVVLDSVVHKVAGKEVEKQVEEEVQNEKLKLARQDTIEKINDYGKRKEVLENADTSYLTDTNYDEASKKGKEELLAKVVKFDKKEETPVRKPPNPIIVKLAKRRPTGPPKPVGLQLDKSAVRNNQKVSPAMKKSSKTTVTSTGERKGSASVSFAATRKDAAVTSSSSAQRPSNTTSSNTARKLSVASSNTTRKTPSPNIGRKTSSTTPSPNTAGRKTSTTPSPNTGHKTTAATLPDQKPTAGRRWK